MDELLHNPQSRIGSTAEAQRLLGQARSELEFVQPGVLLETLDTRLESLQTTCSDVGEALALQYFHVTPWVAWSDAGHRARLLSPERGSLMWRLRVVHTTGYAYGSAGHRVLQRSPAYPAVDYPAKRDPQPGRNHSGHPVLPLRRLLGHRRDGVRSARAAHRTHGDVVLGRRDGAARAAGDEVSWGDLRSEAVIDRFDELVRPTEHTPESKRVAAVGKKIAKNHEPHEAVVAAAEWVRGELEYLPGTTSVHSSGLDALDEGKGVCQDFVHLSLILMRSMGIPGRYVSGYLHPETQRRSRGRGGRPKPRLDRGMDRRLVELRPDQ